MAEMLVSMTNRSKVPDHVPAERVKEFDFFGNPEMRQCPYATISKLHGDGAFFNPTSYRPEGSWVVTSAADIRFILTHPQYFSNKGESGFSQLMGEDWDLIPLEQDPPVHTKFRQMLNPHFSPGAVVRMGPGITHRAVELIESFKDRGGCEFMDAFGRPFPVSIFMQFMGLPEAQTDQFLEWENMLLHDPDLNTKIKGATLIRDYLLGLAAERRAEPTGDLTSFIVQAEIDGRKLTDIEIQGILYLMFVGGLDTVASSLGFFFQHLAQDQEQQAYLRAHPEAIPAAVEEMLRRFSVVTSHRQCLQDIRVGDIDMKTGDWVTIVHGLGSLDAEEFGCPMDIQLDRKNVRHLAFSFGPHFCLGNHLARRELQTALKEWLDRIPQWRIKPGSAVEVHGGVVFGIDRLELEW